MNIGSITDLANRQRFQPNPHPPACFSFSSFSFHPLQITQYLLSQNSELLAFKIVGENDNLPPSTGIFCSTSVCASEVFCSGLDFLDFLFGEPAVSPDIVPSERCCKSQREILLCRRYDCRRKKFVLVYFYQICELDLMTSRD